MTQPTSEMDEQPATADQIERLAFKTSRRDCDHTLEEALVTLSSRDTNGSVKHRRSPPTVDLGAFDRLPSELIPMILSDLPIHTLSRFRLVNRRAADLLGTLPAYETIVTHCRVALRGMSMLGSSRWISWNRLCETVRTSNCEQCGDFAGYIYLVTCKRVCFLCLSENWRYLPLRRSEATAKFGISYETIDSLPYIKPVPGTYSVYPVRKRRFRTPTPVFVDHESAFQAGLRLHGSQTALDTYANDKKSEELEAYNQRIMECFSGGVLRSASQPPSWVIEDPLLRDPVRFAAMVRAPFLAASKEVEWGFHCSGCAFQGERPCHFRRMYDAVSFGKHLREYGEIKNWKHCSD